MTTPAGFSQTILLVEDEPIIAMYEASILKKNSYTVKTAHNAQKAMELLLHEDIGLVLMDIDLGSGTPDGTETAEMILQERELPIVFLTSHGEKEMVERVKGITRYGYVLKNSGEFVLLESINMALELFNAHRETRRSEEYYRSFVNCRAELAALYHHTPMLTVLVDRDRRVLKANSFAAEFAGTPEESLINKRAGEALHCLNSLEDPQGCGFGSECTHCVIRNTVNKTFETGQGCSRVQGRLPFDHHGGGDGVTFLLSTSLVIHEEDSYVIVSLEAVPDT